MIAFLPWLLNTTAGRVLTGAVAVVLLLTGYTVYVVQRERSRAEVERVQAEAQAGADRAKVNAAIPSDQKGLCERYPSLRWDPTKPEGERCVPRS